MSDRFQPDWDRLRQIAECLVEKRGFGIVGGELYRHVVNSKATECAFVLTKFPTEPLAELVVTDNDPEGFLDLNHVYTLFASSFDKTNPEARHVNLKYVLAICREATICTTKGSVILGPAGWEERPRRRTNRGTFFRAIIDCTDERFLQFVQFMRRLIVKPGWRLFVNGDEIHHRKPLATLTEELPTEIADNQGCLALTLRSAEVDLYEPRPGEAAMLYEFGIPVVETGDRWHFDVRQRVPFNPEQEGLPPDYLRHLQASVLRHTRNAEAGRHQRSDHEHATST